MNESLIHLDCVVQKTKVESKVNIGKK